MAFEVSTPDRTAVVDVTDRVADELPADADEGICTVFVYHTTAGVIVNEAESGLRSDIEDTVGQLIPDRDGYAHDRIDDNADSHLRAMLLGESVTVPLRGGELDLGTWQSILLVECDGPRTRRLSVTVAD